MSTCTAGVARLHHHRHAQAVRELRVAEKWSACVCVSIT
jgi:hypothetical protein